MWDHDSILEAFREWHRRTGLVPSYDQWARQVEGSAGQGRYTRRFPSPSTVKRYFPSWESAVAEAGLTGQPRRYHKPGREFRWSRETIIVSIQAWVAKHGRQPKYVEWQSAGEHPSANTVRKHFGSWNEAMEAAGQIPRQGRRSMDDIVADLLRKER